MFILQALVGLTIVAWVLLSAVRTVVIPRPEKVVLSRTVLTVVRWIGEGLARIFGGGDRGDHIRGAYGPVTLLSLPVVWSVGVVAGFALIFAALDVTPWQEALTMSASSLTTLGFVSSSATGVRLVAAVEALLGLGIVALLISFLPTIYSAFARREAAIGHLTVRAGDPPNPVVFVQRSSAIGELTTPTGIESLGERWMAWEEWFIDISESHTTFPALVFFRSARPHRSWINAAESALDTAALLHSLGLGCSGGQQETMIRAGYLALRDIADFFELPHDPKPQPNDSISVDRAFFDDLIDHLEKVGVTSDVDRDATWQAFAGWRVNYDAVIVGLGRLVQAPPSHWERSAQWKVIADRSGIE